MVEKQLVPFFFFRNCKIQMLHPLCVSLLGYLLSLNEIREASSSSVMTKKIYLSVVFSSSQSVLQLGNVSAKAAALCLQTVPEDGQLGRAGLFLLQTL